MAYSTVTSQQFVTNISQVLDDTGQKYWTAQEILYTLYEGLRVWGAYAKYWRASSGLNTGKQCQMAFRANEVNIQFQTRATFQGNTNHKGKA